MSTPKKVSHPRSILLTPSCRSMTAASALTCTRRVWSNEICGWNPTENRHAELRLVTPPHAGREFPDYGT